MSKNCFFSVVYPGVEKYLEDFFQSLDSQDYKDFDCIIGNDNCDDLSKHIVNYDNLNIIVIDVNGITAEVRQAGIKYICDTGYDKVVFGDSDDYFSSNRISNAINKLDENDIVLNDLTIVDINKNMICNNYLSNRLQDNKIIPAEFIKDKNCFGLSNTAVKVSILKDLIIPSYLIAVDWYIFSVLLKEGAKAVFSSKSITYYRQHPDNIIGVGKIDDNKILRGVKVKRLHYQALGKVYEEYKDLSDKFIQIDEDLSKDNNREEYLLYIKEKDIKDPLWWENIMDIKE